MAIATLSSKFQIAIPKEARESLGWRAGQKLVVLRIGSVLKLVAQPSIDDLAGLAAGKDGGNYRDRRDRPARPAAMNVADTCVWIEVLRDSPTGRRYRALLRRSDRLIVPTLVQFELRRWALRELDEDAADRIVAATRAGRVVPVDEAIALQAADLAHEHRLAMADAIIYATARDAKADLVTCDRHFEGLVGVRYTEKASE